MSKLSKKLDSRAQIQLMVGELEDDLELMLRLENDLTAEQKEILEQAGCAIQSETGRVIIGRSKRSALETIAEQEFVEHINVARPMHEDPEHKNET